VEAVSIKQREEPEGKATHARHLVGVAPPERNFTVGIDVYQ
jgi:hypothetical protein